MSGFSIAAPSAFTPRFWPDGKTIAFTYYKGVPQPPTLRFGVEFSERPVVILAIVDTGTRKVTKLTHVGIASDLNTPQWVDDKHILAMRRGARKQRLRHGLSPDPEKPGPLAGPGFGLDAPKGRDAGTLIQVRPSDRP